MSNTLTGIIPTLYEALNTVSRELVGFVPAVRSDTSAARAGLNQTVRVPLAEAGALENIVPGAQEDTGDTTVDYTDVVITKSMAAPIRWTGEEELAVGTNGTYNRILADQFTDGMRKLANAVEADISLAVKVGASRAFGDPAAAPFDAANSLVDLAAIAKILDQNGAPQIDRQIVLGHDAIANLRGKQSVLFKVNEAGSKDMLRTGMTDVLQGFAVRYSGGIAQHVTGAITGATVDGAHAAGIRAIKLKGGSITGTLNAGDVVTFGGVAANKYIVNAADATPTAGEYLTINRPGLVASVTGDAAIAASASYYPNAAFNRNAVVLVTRAPAAPTGGDSADDVTVITDPVSGLSFEVRVYRQYRRVKFEIGLAWGVKVVKPEHVALLIGKS